MSRAIFLSPHGNKRTLRLAHRPSAAGLLTVSGVSDARVNRRWSCASECDPWVAGLRVALRFALGYLTQKIPAEILSAFSE